MKIPAFSLKIPVFFFKNPDSGRMNSPDIDHRPINSVGNVSPVVQYVISELTQPPPSVNTDNVQILTSAKLCSEYQDVLRIQNWRQI